MAQSSEEYTDSDESDVERARDPMAYERGDAILRKIRKLTRDNTTKIPLKFDPLGRLIGDNSVTFQSYLSYLVRDRISIAYPRWNNVPKQTKNGIYDAIQNTFDFPPEKMSKKKVFNNMNTKWKTLKTNTGKLIEDPKTGKALKKAPDRCQFIDQDAWNAFVKYRSTDEFRKSSKANREHAKKKKYPYKASRKGYARLGEEMPIAQGLDPETNLISKADAWKAARSDGHENYGDPETRIIAHKICPEQPDGISCGLYVCRFMRDIIRAGVTEIPNVFSTTSPRSYEEADIFEVIEECVNYLQPFLQLELSLPRHV